MPQPWVVLYVQQGFFKQRYSSHRWGLPPIAHSQLRARIKALWHNSGPAGYDKKVKGKTAEERLDLRCAMKTDKFCK